MKYFIIELYSFLIVRLLLVYLLSLQRTISENYRRRKNEAVKVIQRNVDYINT